MPELDAMIEKLCGWQESLDEKFFTFDDADDVRQFADAMRTFLPSNLALLRQAQSDAAQLTAARERIAELERGLRAAMRPPSMHLQVEFSRHNEPNQPCGCSGCEIVRTYRAAIEKSAALLAARVPACTCDPHGVCEQPVDAPPCRAEPNAPAEGGGA